MKFASAGAALFLAGCVTFQLAYLGSATPFDPSSVPPGPDLLRGIEPVRQNAEKDCGPAALAMVLRYHGEAFTFEDALTACPPDEAGVTAVALRDAARARGFRAHVISGTMDDLRKQIGLGRPVIVGLAKQFDNDVKLHHFEVVAGVRGGDVFTLDPARGWMRNSIDGFLSEWEPWRYVTLVIARKE